MESYVVHFDSPPDAIRSSEPTGIVEDMKNRMQNSFSNTQELMLLLGQFDTCDYPWRENPVSKKVVNLREK